MKNNNKQQGMVLVIGLLYLVIIMMACLSTLENVGLLAVEQTSSIKSYKTFYILESTLLNIEKSFTQKYFSKTQLDNILIKRNIINLPNLLNNSSFEERWKSKYADDSNNGEVNNLVEFLGYKQVNISDDIITEKKMNTWLFRISVAYENEPYFLQSTVQIYPQEVASILAEQDGKKFQSERIAWYERIVDE